MAKTPERELQSTKRSKQQSRFNPKPLPSLVPPTPQTLTPRRSTRRALLQFDSTSQKIFKDPAKKMFNDVTPQSSIIGVKESPQSSIIGVKESPQSSIIGVKELQTDSAQKNKPLPSLTPPTPQSLTPRRSARQASLQFDSTTSQKLFEDSANVKELKNDSAKTCRKEKIREIPKTPKSADKGENLKHKKEEKLTEVEFAFSPVSPEQSETKKRKRGHEKTVVTRATASKNENFEKKNKSGAVLKRKVFYKKVVYDGGEFEVGDDVYVKRREDASSDDEVVEVEECRVCFKSGKAVMIECDDCLGGFHLKCLKPPLKEVPEGDWICRFCETRKLGKEVQLPTPPQGKKRVRTLREKLLSSDLWAAHIESTWKEVDGSYWCRVRWYIIPEETAAGRQAHNLRREIYRTNDCSDIEMESVLRHCFVMNPKEYAKANEGDDVFLCEYEYDIHWHSFKRLSEIDDGEEDDDDEAESDEDWKLCRDSDFDAEEDMDYDEESVKNILAKPSRAHKLAANSQKGQFFGLQKIGMKKIPEHVRCHKQTALEKAKATLLLSSLPKSLPCRDKEMLEITAFIKGAISDDKCLGRCLYIHGVPGTGKTMSVLTVMKNLRSEVNAGSIRPYCFVEINGLKLVSPENIYRVIYEALSGYRVGWKKALRLLNERFSDGKKTGKEDDKPCILLIDELDLLVTRNQSVLYNILDWPTKPHSKLVVIGIANTMDLPEKLLPCISSRMGIQRLRFGPYNYQQLQEIISSRLKGINAFEKQAIEFASRKVAAISGDARRALEICRRAAEITDYQLKKLNSAPNNASEGETLVGMTEVEAAIQEMFQAPHIQVMKTCSKLSKIFLTAMVHEIYKTGMGETTLEKLAMTVSCLCTSNGEAFPGHDTLLKIGCKLGECRIILCESGAKHRLQKLQLNFPSDDVAFALKDSKELPWLAKYL